MCQCQCHVSNSAAWVSSRDPRKEVVALQQVALSESCLGDASPSLAQASREMIRPEQLATQMFEASRGFGTPFMQLLQRRCLSQIWQTKHTSNSSQGVVVTRGWTQPVSLASVVIPQQTVQPMCVGFGAPGCFRSTTRKRRK